MTEMVERVARVICRYSLKQSVNDSGFVYRTGCPDDLGCSVRGNCCERLEILRCSTAWQAARAAIQAVPEPEGWRIDSPEGKKIMELRRTSYEAVCRQTNCADRGFKENDCGMCAWCSDIADDVIETHNRAMLAALSEKP